jgi:ABC-type tungstate transport system permease subunit
VKGAAAAALEKWLAGATAKALINDYKIAGQQLFIHNAQH